MTDSKEELNCGEHPGMNCKKAHEYHVEGLIHRDKTIEEYEKLLDESRERERKLLEAEHKLSDAYLRIRKLVGAWQTPIAPTPEQIYELTENKIKELIKACAN